MAGTFIRHFEIENLSETLIFHQKLEGDVNCVVWDASIVLSKYLEKKFEENNEYLKGLKIIELGAGLGCVGLISACLGANVLSTDLPEFTQMLDLNISTNKNIWSKYGKIESKPLTWGEDTNLNFIPDKILLADCIYYEESIEPLILTLLNLSEVGKTEILISQEIRESETQIKCWKLFEEELNNYFYVSPVPISEQNEEYSSPDIILLKCCRK